VGRRLKRLFLAPTVALIAVPFLSADEATDAAISRPDRYSTTVHFEAGREAASFGLAQPEGVILLYRVSAPVGVEVRGTAQLPSVTVPLSITTSRLGPSSGCITSGDRLICTVGMEWCPMPEGVWRFRLVKIAGPPGNVTLTFKVGQPPGQ
jgi:hypothetical protein